MSAIEELLANNRHYADQFAGVGLPAPPAKKIALVVCMDARLETGALLGLAEGDAHVIRNAGGVVSDDVIRSLTISQCLLGTREIMLVHHTDCGMLNLTDDELKEAVQREAGVRPPFAMGSFADLDGDVRQSIERIKATPFVLYKDDIRGFICDVKTGRLREVE